MERIRQTLFGFLVATLLVVPAVVGQKAARTAPTAADWAAVAKLPDFTGVWEAGLGGGGGGGRGAAPAGGPAAGARGAAPAAAPPARGGGGRGGPGRGAGPALTPAYAAKAAAQANPTSRPEDNETANCLPPGLPGIMGQPYPMEFLLTPGQVTIVIEAYTQVRHIYTDGRPLPEDPDPLFNGTSVGHWEGGTLVVETVGLAQIPRGLTFPYSDKLRVTERFQLTDPDTMTIETSVMDPEALTAPYSMGSRTLKRHRNWTIAEYICEENNRNFVDSEGKAGIKLVNPLASPK